MAGAAMNTLALYVESVPRRTFAGALDWPGWTRAGRDEDAALAALLACAPRYASVLSAAGISFQPPIGLEAFTVQERLPGGSATAFGAPEAIPAADRRPLDAEELARLLSILGACRTAFLQALQAAEGRTLRTGPRGGGRDRDRMLVHVLEAEQAYLASLGWKHAPDRSAEARSQLAEVFAATDAALAASIRGEIPAIGPRGGQRWSARVFIRRSAWHLLDHAWEIADRLEG